MSRRIRDNPDVVVALVFVVIAGFLCGGFLVLLGMSP